MTVSKSPDRHTFQKEKYLERCDQKDKEPSQEYLEMFDQYKYQHDHKFDDPKSRVNNLEYDLLTTDWILEKVRNSDSYAQNLYAALCNNDFIKNDVFPMLKEEKWSCSWRYAGGIISDMQEKGDYIDWYCSGIGSDLCDEDFYLLNKHDQERYLFVKNHYITEGVVTEEIRKDLLNLGWIII